jgi:3-methyl-2-oxobutanoate hydroxymethyltransferase
MENGRERFARMKAAREPIVMLTCYDYPTALLQDEAGVDVIFVGDSVGTNVLGYGSETEVTMADMLHHLRAVRRGVRNAYLLVDMPHGSYATPETALSNAEAFLAAGADGVKLEGGRDQAEVVRTLTAAGFEVCGHIGFTPQTLGSKGRVQGKSSEQGRTLVESAEALADAGVILLVLELVTEQVAAMITDRIRVPTISIGSGRYCDGQVLVVNDVLGMTPFARRLHKRYAEWRDTAGAAIRQYVDEVRTHRFPTEANAFPADQEELARLEEMLAAAR